jgi:hypothetical protein
MAVNDGAQRARGPDQAPRKREATLAQERFNEEQIDNTVLGFTLVGPSWPPPRQRAADRDRLSRSAPGAPRCPHEGRGVLLSAWVLRATGLGDLAATAQQYC